MALYIDKTDEKRFHIKQVKNGNTEADISVSATFKAITSEAGRIMIKDMTDRSISYSDNLSELYINGVLAPQDSDEAGALLDAFIGSFKSGGSASGLTLQAVPDYANMETINRITANNGTWKADRDGFVYCFATYTGSSSTANGSAEFHIDGKVVWSSGWINPYGGSVLPIMKGQTLKFVSTSTTPACEVYFIPPTFIGIEFAPVVAENFKNYQCIPDYANMTGNIGTGTNPIT